MRVNSRRLFCRPSAWLPRACLANNPGLLSSDADSLEVTHIYPCPQVSFPGDSSFGYDLFTDPDEDYQNNKKGAVVSSLPSQQTLIPTL